MQEDIKWMKDLTRILQAGITTLQSFDVRLQTPDQGSH